MQLLIYALQRLTEPSSYAGLAAILVAWHVDPQLQTPIVTVCIGLAGVAAFLLKEKTKGS